MITERERRSTDIPKWLEWSFNVFDRAGFPAMAFVLIVYVCFITLKEQTKTIEQFRVTMIQMTSSIDRNTASVQQMTTALYRTRP